MSEFLDNLAYWMLVILACIVVATVITMLIFSPKRKTEEPIKKTVLAASEKSEFIEEFSRQLEKPLPPKKAQAKTQELTYEEAVLLKILTHEAGCDQQLCYYVVQALFNACEKHHWQYSPLGIAFAYQYTCPLEWYSNEALTAYKKIFYESERFPEIGNATIFYAPAYCSSSYHESQIFVYEFHGVRFFEER